MISRLKSGGEKVRRAEQNGVPIYHVVDGGPARAALMFRVGRGDEEPASAGATHLVEHLALFPFGQQAYQYNGMVDPIRTVFVAAGTPAEVVEHLTALCRNLADLPVDRLETEQRVLRDEAGRRSIGPPDHHGWLRWGLRGPGLAFIPEYGLWRLGAADVRAWTARWFNAGNAALVWAGPKLPALDLPLSSGERRPPQPLTDLLREPVWAVGAPDHVTISFTLKRDSAGAAAQRVLAKRLQQQLRYERGLSYDVSLHYQPLSADIATSTLWASCGVQDALAVRDVVIDVARQLERDGPSLEELASDRDGMRRSREQPFEGQGEADRLAFQELLGAPPETLDFLEAELAKVTPEAAREAFRVTMRTTILTQPQGLEPPREWLAAYPNLAAPVLPGRKFHNRADSIVPFLRRLPAVVVGDEGVSLAAKDGTGYGIRFADTAVLVRQGSGALSVMHENGTQIDIDPMWWKGAEDAIAMAKGAVPTDRFVQLDDAPATTANVPPVAARALSWRRLALIGVLGISLIVTGYRLFVNRAPGGGPLVSFPAVPTVAPEVGNSVVSFASSALASCGSDGLAAFRLEQDVWWSVQFETARPAGSQVSWVVVYNGANVATGTAAGQALGSGGTCITGGPIELDGTGPYRLSLKAPGTSQLLAEGLFFVTS